MSMSVLCIADERRERMKPWDEDNLNMSECLDFDNRK